MAATSQLGAEAVLATPADRAVAFISYAREDKDFALQLTEALLLKGIEVRGDRQLVRGESYEIQLQDLQLGSDIVVFVISPDSIDSGQSQCPEVWRKLLAIRD